MAVLTSKGAVFTWGDSNYGQLGHGNTNQQIVPRQVLELMGNKVRDTDREGPLWEGEGVPRFYRKK